MSFAVVLDSFDISGDHISALTSIDGRKLSMIDWWASSFPEEMDKISSFEYDPTKEQFVISLQGSSSKPTEIIFSYFSFDTSNGNLAFKKSYTWALNPDQRNVDMAFFGSMTYVSITMNNGGTLNSNAYGDDVVLMVALEDGLETTAFTTALSITEPDDSGK